MSQDLCLADGIGKRLVANVAKSMVRKRLALAHHILQNHDAEIPCFGCNETIPSLTKMLDHFRTKHTKSLIACVYCKSVFGKPNDMTENQWKRLKTHMYGVSYT
ncbi:unnamed protein product [Cylicostephanus goldi]|uniref:C2H2-type domain-containing protein n=1 Tax=Cylicostephanus goldi TaxID=71465 RepID=A0A3P6UG83_CYLGO|nr:unnamed protein product [Cylicostephanus goldi]